MVITQEDVILSFKCFKLKSPQEHTIDSMPYLKYDVRLAKYNPTLHKKTDHMGATYSKDSPPPTVDGRNPAPEMYKTL